MAARICPSMCDGSLWEQQRGGGGQKLPAIASLALACGHLPLVQVVVGGACAQKVAGSNPYGLALLTPLKGTLTSLNSLKTGFWGGRREVKLTVIAENHGSREVTEVKISTMLLCPFQTSYNPAVQAESLTATIYPSAPRGVTGS